MSAIFAFDPLAGEEASTLNRLTILQARMNPDLVMGEELLKKTGTGNLFMVFGERDIDVRPVGEGQLEVEIRGLDVFDPTSGELGSSSVADIGDQPLWRRSGEGHPPATARSSYTATSTNRPKLMKGS